MISFYTKWAGRERQRPANRSGVLVVAAGGIGDAIMLAHVFPRFAALAKDGETVTLLLRADAARAAFLYRGQAQVLAVDFTRLGKSYFYRRRMARQLRSACYRAVISADYLRHPKLDEALIDACRAAETYAMEPRPWPKYERQLARNRNIYTRLFDSGPVLKDKILRWVAYLDWLGAPKIPLSLNLPAGKLPPARARARPLAVLAPFSAVKAKQCPAALYARLIERLGGAYDVVLTGAPNDLDRNPSFGALLDLPNGSFEDANFENLLPILRAATVVIAADTATMHLAVAAGAPTLCLASAAYVGEITPYAPEISPPNSHTIYVPMECAGCLGVCIHPLENEMYRCVADLSEATVLEKLDEILAVDSP